MTPNLPKFCDSVEAKTLVAQLGDEFAVIRNPSGDYPAYEVCPLVPKRTRFEDGLSAILMDMDGTFSSTEDLVVQGLELTTRYVTGKGAAWAGLDKDSDFPHIVGNSNTQNLSYLLAKYGSDSARLASIDEAVAIYGYLYGRLLGIEEGLAVAQSLDGAIREELDGLIAMYSGSGDGIRSMEGVGAFIALVRGFLGDEADACSMALGRYFETRPVKLALVTSSSRQEAVHVVESVRGHLLEEMENWGLSAERAARIREELFASSETLFPTIVTADDSHEIRLKPHRDLYTIALQRLNIAPDECHKVLALEDSEAGVIATRAAGIPLCCALPHEGTAQHDFSAASWVCRGGLRELVVERGLFLPDPA